MMDVALLGTGGMMPLPNRYLTSMLCRYGGRMLMIDCGEGTQVSLKLLGWGYKNIDIICFTHYHADHITGLPGLMYAISNAGREEPLTLIGPPELRRIAEGLLVVATDLNFDIRYMELPYKRHDELPLEGTDYFLSALPLQHGKPCFGYAVSTKRAGRFDLERAEALALPKRYWSILQRGETVVIEDVTYTPDMVLGPERRGFKLCYITDTRPTKRIPAFVKDANLFICEGMYGDPEKRELARSHMHMVYSEAAALARDGEAEELWLTHYSPAMVNPKEHIDVARAVFKETRAGYDRMVKTLVFKD